MVLPSRISLPSPVRRVLLLAVLMLGVTGRAQDTTYPPLPRGATPITVLDAKGRFVGRLMPQKRYAVTLDRVPAFLQRALLAVEDPRFYEHGALDIRGIARAFMHNVVKGRAAEGGSTITQQLMKNKYLTGEKSLDRKVQEARMAVEFEKTHTKAQILEMYFNEIYFGNGAWGIAQASRLYFNKAPEELSEAECLALAGVPKNPGRYNPLGRPEDTAGRRDVVLKRMEELDLITGGQRQALMAHPAVALPPGQAPHYLARIRAQLLERFGPDILEWGGLEITAAVDLDLQRQAEQILRDGVRRVAKDLQGALVCMDPATGDVLAAVGGLEGNADGVNRAFNSLRQPGSAIKPVLFAAALEKGVTAGSIWSDEPVAYDWGGGNVWKPLNYGGEQFGEISLREALAHSDNIIAVKVLESVGVPYFVDFAGRMGLTLKAKSGLSLALGADEVTLKDLVQTYTSFAAGGTRAEARTILRIRDRRTGAVTEIPPVLTPVVSPAVAFVTTSMLQDVLAYGTAHALAPFGKAHAAAGKTGTTDDGQDAWFVGYTPGLITGLWVGADRPRPGGRGFTGGAVAAPIWERFMTRALASRPEVEFARPEGVVTVTIDPATGMLATEACPVKREENYVEGTQPVEPCPRHPAPVTP